MNTVVVVLVGLAAFEAVVTGEHEENEAVLIRNSTCGDQVQNIYIQTTVGDSEVLRGEKGDQGIAGPQGAKGDHGVAGPHGMKGNQGIAGPQGAKGDHGVAGPHGAKGDQGIAGPHGMKGNQGIAGPQGAKGDHGVAGPHGMKGDQGIAGPHGMKGNQGIAGPHGAKGDQGIAGPHGAKGDQGITGMKGMKGNQGIAGPHGVKGNQGIAGPHGAKGSKGMKGITGLQGPRGYPGITGPPGPAVGGATYIRWGRDDCPSTPGTVLLYSGMAAGSFYDQHGGGNNYLCLPENPQYLSYRNGVVGDRAFVYGAEYKIHDTPAFAGRHNHNVPCAVCHTPTRGAKIMIPARTSCPTSWTREYYGYLMAEKYHHARSAPFECVDRYPESIPGTSANTDGALFYFTEARCHGICPPYVDGKELTCAVCTK